MKKESLNTEGGKTKLYIVAIVVLLVLITILLVEFAGGKNKTEGSATDTTAVNEAEQDKLYDNAIIEEIVTVDTEIIEDGLRRMGELITEEYYFTQVETYTNTKKFIEFLESTATFTYSYDGVVTAGIDCNDVKIDKDDENKVITITIPKSEIFSVNVDRDSFKIFEEKNGIFNKADLSMFNESQAEFENAARNKAIEKGIIEKADEGAEKMIESFARSLMDTDEYKLEIVQE